jgi:hypothetical protein
MNRQPPSRLLTTSARVHPPYLPYLHNASNRGRSLKWLPPLAAAVTAGLAVSHYRDTQQQQQAAFAPSSSGSGRTSPAQEQAEAERHRRRRQEAAMEDAYGDRGGLAELEGALAVYEAQRRG